MEQGSNREANFESCLPNEFEKSGTFSPPTRLIIVEYVLVGIN
jgi:hypothetical protein